MKKFNFSILFVFFLLTGQIVSGQVGNRFGRQRNAIPQVQTPPPEPEKLTAAQYVDKEMPRIKELMELDPFEEAVVRSTLEKYVQKRMELQILQLEPKKMKEEYEKIRKLQDAELKAGLPEEKYQIYLDMQENPSKAKRKKKKRKKEKAE